jgi:tellurite resistance protein TerC
MMFSPVLYLAFAAIVAGLLVIDLFLVQRDPHVVSVKEAAIWTAIWIGVAVAFGLVVFVFLHDDGGKAVVEYFTGYLIEYSLSVDNVFLFVLIFSALSVPRELRHRVLFYGVLGAIVMRTLLILTGTALVQRFEWILYVFGGFLLYVAFKTWRDRDEEKAITDSRLLKQVRCLLPTTDNYQNERFWVRENGKLLATPLFVVLILVECTDLIFAIDSIPAILTITQTRFIVLTSNIFAILGLRSLYFLVAGAADRLRYLNEGLAVILGFVGLKLLTEKIPHFPHPSPLGSLGIIAGILVVVIVASLWMSWREQRKGQEVAPALVRHRTGEDIRHR